MATTISDVVVPELFAAYVSKRTAETSALVRSGIITQNEQLNDLAEKGSTHFSMPYWDDLVGESEVITEGQELTVGGTKANFDMAHKMIRGKAWGASDLSGALAGSSPLNDIVDKVSEWWVRDEQKTLLAILKGVFASTTMAGHVLDASSDGINGEMVLDAKQLLGDNADRLTTLALHSAVYTQLQKLQLIEYIPDPITKVLTPTYLGYKLLVDDGMPKEGDVFTTYLFAGGVIGRGDGNPVDFKPSETGRNKLKGEDYVISRRCTFLHPFGIKFTRKSVAKETPTNAEFEKATNWERVYEPKQIGIVKLQHKLIADAPGNEG